MPILPLEVSPELDLADGHVRRLGVSLDDQAERARTAKQASVTPGTGSLQTKAEVWEAILSAGQRPKPADLVGVKKQVTSRQPQYAAKGLGNNQLALGGQLNRSGELPAQGRTEALEQILLALEKHCRDRPVAVPGSK